MATKKPMKKSRRYDVGGEVATDEPMTRRITFNNDGTRTQSFGEQVASRQKMGGDESALKQKGLEVSNKDAKPSGFLDSIKSTFSRLGEGSIDTPGSEAYNKYGAGRARAAAPVPVANQLTPKKVSIGDAAYEDERAKKRAMERSRVMQQDISAGTDFVDRPQDEGYRPYISPKDRAIAEGEKDSDKIIENTGPRTKPIVSPSKPTAPKPSAIKAESKMKSAPKAPAYLQRYTEQMMEADNPRSVEAEKVSAEKAKPAASPPSVPKASSSKVPTSEQASANRAAVAEKFKGMGSSVANYFSNFETPAKRKAREQKEKAAKGSYASGGSVSSASKRADGIATKGKTRGRMC
jgi:hypothetical protein